MISTYDSSKWVVMVAGVHITQIAEDGCSGSKDNEISTATEGLAGDAIKNKNNSKLGSVKIPVMATCPQLPHLMKLANEDDFYPVWATNTELGITYGGDKATLKNLPEVADGKEAGNREFEFQVYDYEATQA